MSIIVTERPSCGQGPRCGPFSPEHLELLMDDFASWKTGEGRTSFVISDWWADPPCPELPLIVDFHALVEAGIPVDEWEERIKKDPLSVTFFSYVTEGGNFHRWESSLFRWPSDADSEDGARPRLPFPFFTCAWFEQDGDAPAQFGINNLPGFSPTDQQLEWCYEIARTWQRRGFLIWWCHWKNPKVGISCAQHGQLVREGFRRMDTKASERCRFPNDSGAEITNAWQEENVIPPKYHPLELTQILESLAQRFGEWPRRIGDLLFVLDESGEPRYLSKTHALFSWYSLFGLLHWRNGKGFVEQPQFFEALRSSAKSYAAVEALPHEPALHDRFYLRPAPEPGDGSALNGLLNRFTPETEHDRQLIAAMFATVIWGETGGQRPAFLLTADCGRGAGKTSLAQMVGVLAAGLFRLRPSDDGPRVMTRLVSPGALTLRVALVDNVKSMQFSWDELESLITANEIRGHRLYSGDAARPNNLVWILTVNGASLSTDMAQRCVTIKLDRPTRSGNWEEETIRFIRENRQLILGDLIGLLRRDKQPLKQHSRWARWESDVLSRLDEPAELQRLILERQQGADAEADAAAMIEEHFQQQLSDLNLDTTTERLFIPFDVAYQWFCSATGERNVTKNAASRRLNQAIAEGRIKRLVPARLNSGRGYQWNGVAAMTDVDYAAVQHAIEQRRILDRGRRRNDASGDCFF